jgi:hypothetical protein
MATVQKILIFAGILLSALGLAVSLYLLFNFGSLVHDALDGYQLRQIRQNFDYDSGSTPDSLPHTLEIKLL